MSDRLLPEFLCRRAETQHLLFPAKCLTDLAASHVECTDLGSGTCNSGAKLELLVVSDKFDGVPLLQRHRMVNDCLTDIMPRIHALTMKTWTSAQYASKK